MELKLSTDLYICPMATSAPLHRSAERGSRPECALSNYCAIPLPELPLRLCYLTLSKTLSSEYYCFLFRDKDHPLPRPCQVQVTLQTMLPGGGRLRSAKDSLSPKTSTVKIPILGDANPNVQRILACNIAVPVLAIAVAQGLGQITRRCSDSHALIP